MENNNLINLEYTSTEYTYLLTLSNLKQTQYGLDSYSHPAVFDP